MVGTVDVPEKEKLNDDRDSTPDAYDDGGGEITEKGKELASNNWGREVTDEIQRPHSGVDLGHEVAVLSAHDHQPILFNSSSGRTFCRNGPNLGWY